MPSEPKHRVISQELLAEIAAGRFGPTGRLPSETQLVRRFGVSRPTVARALRDLQEQGLVERRVGSGTFVRSTAPQTMQVAGRQLGLMIPGLGATEIFGAICGELASLARGHDYTLLWGSSERAGARTTPNVAEIATLCEQFISQRVSGVFFAPFEHIPDRGTVNLHLVEQLQKAGIAVVLLDRDLGPFPARSEFDLVGIDNFAAGYLTAEHLLKLGCRRIAFASRVFAAPTIRLRIAGAREALIERGVEVRADFVQEGEPDDPQFLQRLVEQQAVEAVICANDHFAAMLAQALERRGLRVPRDMRLVGFDDVRFATLLSAPLTTVHQPCREIAMAAFRTMLERIANPTLPARTVTLAARLAIRESCGAYMPQSDVGHGGKSRPSGI